MEVRFLAYVAAERRARGSNAHHSLSFQISACSGSAGGRYARRVLFERRLQDGLRNGSIRLVFRRWRRAQCVRRQHYRSPSGFIDVQRVSLLDGPISTEDARAAGYASVEQLLADMKGPADGRLYRIELQPSIAPDAREVLAHEALLGDADLTLL